MTKVALRGLAGRKLRAVLTGIASALVAWSDRSPSLLGRAAWLLVVGWAVHVALIAGLIAAGVLDPRALESEPKPFATLWFSVTIYVMVLLGASWLITKRRERARSGRSAGRR